MEIFSLTLVSGWNNLKALLIAAGYTGQLTWEQLVIKNADATAVVVLKSNSVNAPGSVNGWTLSPGITSPVFASRNASNIDGSRFRLNSNVGGSCEVSFLIKTA